jgi:hypothetical protein
MKTHVIIPALCILVSYTVTAQRKEFSWLLGTWKMKNKNVFEVWTLANDGKALEGISYEIKEADTIVMEKILFTYKDNAYYYIPDVAGDQGSVDFKILKHSAEGFIAENPQHDFPKTIRYRFIRKDDRDTIEASIEGDGKVILYAFDRVR